MKAIGVDIIEISRIVAAIQRFDGHFLERVYTPAEQVHCQRNAASLAVRWAAKEAVAKALGCGIGRVQFVEIEVAADQQNRPMILLHGAARSLAQELGWQQVLISLSHSRECALAVAVAV